MANDEVPQQTYRQEIESALEKDTTRIGDVFRARRDDEDKNARSIADELGIITSEGISQTIPYVNTLIAGRRLTSRRTAAARTAGKIRGFYQRHKEMLSDETVARLMALEADHNRVASDEEAIVRENEQIEQETEKQEESGSPGIYVYSYPHYMNYPVIPSEEEDATSRTYLKIGRSETDAEERAKGQQNLTAVPEPIMLLRIYTHSDRDLKEVEDMIHDHLDAADHNQVNKGRRRGRKRESGQEWFLTHIPFIDSTAKLLGLDTEYAHEEDYSS